MLNDTGQNGIKTRSFYGALFFTFLPFGKTETVNLPCFVCICFKQLTELCGRWCEC